jgi:MarR family transcriptional regulator, temperature-dependent positive regulator of motility
VTDNGFELEMAPGHLVRRAQQLHNELWSAVIGDDLTSVQFAVLFALSIDPGLDQTTLAERVFLDPSNCHDVVVRLVGRQLVARTRDENDGRRWRIQLTDRGAATVVRVLPDVREVGRRLLEPLDGADGRRLLELLSRLLAPPASPTARTSATSRTRRS